MELWIRSQDKSVLINCKSLHLESSNCDEAIYANQCCLIGKYSKYRALEVLNKIQETLMMCIKANGNEHLVGTSCYVYQMPQE